MGPVVVGGQNAHGLGKEYLALNKKVKVLLLSKGRRAPLHAVRMDGVG